MAVALLFLICHLFLTRSGTPLGVINDFLDEAYFPLQLLYHGHVHHFLAVSPGYVGALIGREPFAAVAIALHGSWQMIYFASAVPCVIAPAVLAWWLATRVNMGANASRRWIYLSPLSLLFIINPVFIFDIIWGHPEDVLGSALVVAATVQAARDRALWSGLLAGLAVDNKTWALVIVPVTFAVLTRDRGRAAAVLLISVLALYGPVELLAGGHGASNLGSATGTIFEFDQVWWFLGSHSWVAGHAHPLIVIIAAACSAAWWLLRGREVPPGPRRIREALWLAALVLLLRSALDPWDNMYYQLPFLVAIYVLEFGRAPRLSVVLTIVLTALTVPLHLYGVDLRAAAYLVTIIPLILIIGLRTYRPADAQGLMQRLTESRGAELGTA